MSDEESELDALRRVRTQAEIFARAADSEFASFSKFLLRAKIAAESQLPMDLSAGIADLGNGGDGLAKELRLLLAAFSQADAARARVERMEE